MAPAPLETRWYDVFLPYTTLLRILVALFTVVAGAVALFTDRALIRRLEPLAGFWKVLKNTPLENRKLTPWGWRILAIVTLAGTLQYFGDVLKDRQTEIESYTETQGVVTNIRHQLEPMIGEQDAVLHKVNEQLYPFQNIGWSWTDTLNQETPAGRALLSAVVAAMNKEGTEDFWIPKGTSPGAKLKEKEESVVAGGIANASAIRVSIADVWPLSAGDASHSVFASRLVAPRKFEKRTDLARAPGEATNFRCSSPAPATFDSSHCDFSAYPGAPLADGEGTDFPHYSKIRYLDGLAGKYLVIQPWIDEKNPLRLETICMHIRDQSLCFESSEFRPSFDRNGRPVSILQFPPDLESIVKRLRSGTLQRSHYSDDGSKTFTIPE